MAPQAQYESGIPMSEVVWKPWVPDPQVTRCLAYLDTQDAFLTMLDINPADHRDESEDEAWFAINEYYYND
jgi:hypothetical protein